MSDPIALYRTVHSLVPPAIVRFQKIFILPSTEGVRISWGGVGCSLRQEHLKRDVCGGGGVLEKIPSVRGGMDIFWNYILPSSKYDVLRIS